MIGAVVLLGLLAFQDAEPAAGDEPVRTTIAEIHEDPWAWHGRTVRVVGVFDHCHGFECTVCDPGVIFRDQPGDDQRIGPARCAGIAFDWSGDTDQLLRYNRIEFIAEYSAECSQIAHPDNPNRITVCTDRAPQFTGIGISRFVTYRPATALPLTTVSWQHFENRTVYATRVSPADPELALELGDAYRRATPYIQNRDGIALYAYAITEPPNNIAPFGICVAFGRFSEPLAWPSQLHQLNRALGNPYTCYFAARDEGGEVFFPLQ